eukprot:COSAG02_NODE_2085_length_9885_cov_9.743946_4_plen_439_part_00
MASLFATELTLTLVRPAGHYKLRLKSIVIENNRVLCNPTDECMHDREAHQAVRSGPNSAHSTQRPAAPGVSLSIRAPKDEPEDIRIGAAAAKEMSQADRQKAIDAVVAKHRAAQKSTTEPSTKASTIGVSPPTTEISRAASQKAIKETVARHVATKRSTAIVDLTSLPDDFVENGSPPGNCETASPIPDGALVGTASAEQNENSTSGFAGRNDEVGVAATSHNDVTRDPRRRRPPVTAPAQDPHQQLSQQPGHAKKMQPQPSQQPPTQLQPPQEQLLLQQQQQQQQQQQEQLLPLGPKPNIPASRLFLYKRQEKPHELSWICFEQGLNNRNSFPVPDCLVAHMEQVIRIAVVKELQTLPSRRVWNSGPRGEREWPKMRSKLLSSTDSTQPNKVVVCSPGLADRLFNTETAAQYKGHYYLSGERLYYDESGWLKKQYFK